MHSGGLGQKPGVPGGVERGAKVFTAIMLRRSCSFVKRWSHRVCNDSPSCCMFARLLQGENRIPLH